jgi:hypothetical protein
VELREERRVVDAHEGDAHAGLDAELVEKGTVLVRLLSHRCPADLDFPCSLASWFAQKMSRSMRPML